ncbi:hypothetical protein [Aggregatilinea lenta]|uniref:hypothetical protein n=1 Tax=Aggregatilinea lenta TaxID=913108 RepID=UPI0013C2F12F|nr:hypothetical protein [Aggregatilinea lenta]
MARRTWWMLSVVLGALVLAAAACSGGGPAHFENARMAADEDGDRETYTYAPGDTFYLLVEVKGGSDDTSSTAAWRIVQAAGVEPDYLIGSFSLEGSGGKVFRAQAPDEGWPVGQYAVDLYLDRVLQYTLEFDVR